DYLARKYPNWEFVPFHPGKNYTDFYDRYNNLRQFPYSYKDKIMARLGVDKLKDYEGFSDTYDGLLFLGGGIFREESYWKEVYTYRSEITGAFLNRNKPVWFMGCNFGPYTTNRFLDSYRKLFSKVTRVHFRDEKSYQLFAEIPAAFYYPDMLWDYSLPAVRRHEKILGISLIDPRHKDGMRKFFYSYIAAHSALIKRYISLGYRIRLFSFCAAEGDLDIAEVLGASSDKIEIINYRGEIKSYLELIGECSLMVAARFHASIVAIKYRIPLLPVIYSN